MKEVQLAGGYPKLGEEKRMMGGGGNGGWLQAVMVVNQSILS